MLLLRHLLPCSTRCMALPCPADRPKCPRVEGAHIWDPGTLPSSDAPFLFCFAVAFSHCAPVATPVVGAPSSPPSWATCMPKRNRQRARVRSTRAVPRARARAAARQVGRQGRCAATHGGTGGRTTDKRRSDLPLFGLAPPPLPSADARRGYFRRGPGHGTARPGQASVWCAGPPAWPPARQGHQRSPSSPPHPASRPAPPRVPPYSLRAQRGPRRWSGRHTHTHTTVFKRQATQRVCDLTHLHVLACAGAGVRRLPVLTSPVPLSPAASLDCHVVVVVVVRVHPLLLFLLARVWWPSPAATCPARACVTTHPHTHAGAGGGG